MNGEPTSKIRSRMVPRYRRRFGVVFQDHRLLFDRSVHDNVALPLVMAGFSPTDIARRVRAALDKVGLLSHEQANPAVLSGVNSNGSASRGRLSPGLNFSSPMSPPVISTPSCLPRSCRYSRPSNRWALLCWLRPTIYR